MLVLRRKVGECLVLAETITICILAVEGERVKVGICAPQDIAVVRKELLPIESSLPKGPLASPPH